MRYITILLMLCCLGCFDAVETAHREFKPSTLLKKYEWFKDVAAAIDKKRADIALYQSEIEDFKPEDKEDKAYIQQRKSELLGIIGSHNQLCAEYNAAMVKFNYAFTNVGSLPEGAETPLPREYKPYINNLKSNK